MIQFTELIVHDFMAIHEATYDFRPSATRLLLGRNKDSAAADDNGCLVGDTLVDCPRDLEKHPKGIPLRDLVGTQPYVYCWGENGIQIRQASKVFLSKKDVPVIRVRFSKFATNKGAASRGGKYYPPQELVGTPDHPVLTIRGENDYYWKPLGELAPGDRVVSMYRKESGGWRTLVYWTGVHQKHAFSEQQFVCREINGECPEGYQAHHINGNSMDHSVGNLEWKDRLQHLSEHTSQRNKEGLAGWRVSGVHPRGMVGKKHSVEARRRISESLKKQYQDGLRVNHTVLSVEECGRQDVYDVIVPGAANFVANGVVVHNSGKSSLAEALKWGLYGETTRQAVDKSLTVDHVIRKGAGAAEVMVMFEVNHEAWSVTRSRSAKTHTLEVTQTSPAGGTQTWTGVPAQEQLARVLGVDAVQFSNFVYLDGSYPLLFAPSNDRTRKDILADLVDVAIVQQAQDLVATRLSPLKNQMLQVEKEMSECRVVIDTYKESMLQDIRDQAQNLRTELAAAEEKLLTVEKVLISEQLAHETAEKELDQAQATETAALDTLKQELRVSQVKVENLTREREQVRDSYLRNVIEVAQNRVTELRQQTVLTDKEIARIQYLRSEGKCSKCGQDTTNLERDGLEALHLEKEISGNELSKAEAVYQEVEKKRQEKLDAVSRELEHAKKLQAERQRNLLDAGESPKVARLKDKVRQAERVVAQRESQRAVCQNSITSIKRSLAEKKSLYLKHKEQIEKGKVRLKDLQEEAASLDKQIHNLEFWKTGFGPKGVPSLFIETVLPRISSCIQRFADILTGGDLAVTLRAYKETKSKTVQEAIQISAVNAKGASVYGANSAGERNRINLAVTLGLVDYFRSMGVFSSNILICDEIFDGLDRTGVEMALQALQEATIPHVLVISHHEHLKPLFPDAMYMVKENGQARLEA